MENFQFKVEQEHSKQRLDSYLARKLPKEFSRSYVKKLIDGNFVLLNNEVVKSCYKVKSGDQIQVTIPEPVETNIIAENIPLDIVYEDKDLLVVNKPAGMVVHPAAGNFSNTLVNALLYHTKDLSGIGGVQRPGIVHRLDKETSGLLVVAKTDFTHQDLAKQFRRHTVKRKYIAFVRGIIQLDQGTVEAPIGRHPRQRKKMAVKFSDSKRAVTHYKVVRRYKDYTMLELTLETGRTHQIRAHMTYIGHPLLGDATYSKRHGVNRQALHAISLGFYHPTLKKNMEFKSELPDDIKTLAYI